MHDCSRYVTSENIERFEELLRGGRLDRRQVQVVTDLLAQARAELASLNTPCRGRAMAAAATAGAAGARAGSSDCPQSGGAQT